MARGTGALNGTGALKAAVPGWAAAGLVVAVMAATLAAVAWAAGGVAMPGASDWAAVRFTVLQAALSAVASVGLAVPLARALARRRFRGRRILIAVMGAPFVLPTIVAVFGLLALFGREGPVNAALAALGLPQVSIFGLQGVVLAHVFLNLPFATRLILQGWADIPAERFRLAATLGFSARDVARHLERPMLRAVLPGAALAVFVICLTSFAVALTLGGGPRATTVELAIYQAFRFDFDLARAASLALLQFAMCAAAGIALLSVARMPGFGAGLDRASGRPDADGALRRTADAAIIAAGAAFVALPLLAVAADGAGRIAALPAPVWEAAARSVGVALGATVLTLALAVPIALAAAEGRRGATALELAATLGLVASPLVLGTGLFLLVRAVTDPVALALPVTALVNALLSVPFAVRAILPPARSLHADWGRLADSLGMEGLARLRLVTIPRLAGPVGFAAGLAAALSMGDLGAIALFADPSRATLPLELQRLMAAYRMDDAAGAAVLLMLLTLGIFWLFDRGGRGIARA